MLSRERRLLWVAVLAVILGSCGVGDGETRPSGRIGVAYWLPVRCEEAVLNVPVEELGPDMEVIGGVVALRTSASSNIATQVRRAYDADPALRLGAKTPLWVRRNTMAEIRVPATFHERVAIAWGYYGVPTHRITVGPCPAEEEWLGFSGGVYVADPECITLEVVHKDSTVETIEMGLGTPCPGQEQRS